MKFAEMSDGVILSEIGERVKQQRLNRNITQAQLAQKAGVSRTAVQRVEQGEECTLKVLLRIMRALGLLEQLEMFLPEPGHSPIQIAKLQGRVRRRASGGHTSKGKKSP